MNTALDNLGVAVTALEAKVSDQGNTITELNVKVTHAVSELAELKTLLDTAIANSTSAADQASMQAIADRVSALTTKLDSNNTALQNDAQGLSDAEAAAEPSN